MGQRFLSEDSKSYIRVWFVTKRVVSFPLRLNCKMPNAPSILYAANAFYPPVIVTVLGREYKIWRLSLRNIPHCRSMSHSHSNIFLRTSFATTRIYEYRVPRDKRPKFQINTKSQRRGLLQVKIFCPACRLQLPSRQTHSKCINCITYVFPLTAYRLGVQGSIPALLHSVQTDSEVHPASYPKYRAGLLL